jgi:hypothetical protein
MGLLPACHHFSNNPLSLVDPLGLDTSQPVPCVDSKTNPVTDKPGDRRDVTRIRHNIRYKSKSWIGAQLWFKH